MVKKMLIGKIMKLLFLKILLPLVIALIIFTLIASAVIEIPKAIAVKIYEFFAGLFDSEDEEDALTLLELKEFFLTNPSIDGLEELHSPLLLVKFIDLQIDSGLGKVPAEKTILVQTDKHTGYLTGTSSKVEVEVDFEGKADFATSPWQYMSAVDIANENFGIDDISSEVKIFNSNIRPLFDGMPSNEFIPTLYTTITTTKKYRKITIIHEDLSEEVEEEVEKNRRGEGPKEKETETIYDDWTEVITVKVPQPLYTTVDFFAGRKEYEYEYKDTTEKDSNTKILEDSFIRTVRLTTSIETVTSKPVVKDNRYIYSLQNLKNSLLWSVPPANMDLFAEIVSGYPFSGGLSLLADKAISLTKLDFGENYDEITHVFDYPSLKFNDTGKYYREDIINLGRSVIGLDYFWGGKYLQQGFSPNWGKMELVTSPGNSTSNKYIRYGFDCSGFVQWAYHNAGLPLEGSTYTMLAGDKIERISLDQLLPGDLGFYNDYSNGETGNHVGIYLGFINGQHLFVHAGGPIWKDENHPTGQVIISALNEEYNGYQPVRFKKFYRYTYKDLEM